MSSGETEPKSLLAFKLLTLVAASLAVLGGLWEALVELWRPLLAVETVDSVDSLIYLPYGYDWLLLGLIGLAGGLSLLRRKAFGLWLCLAFWGLAFAEVATYAPASPQSGSWVYGRPPTLLAILLDTFATTDARWFYVVGALAAFLLALRITVGDARVSSWLRLDRADAVYSTRLTQPKPRFWRLIALWLCAALLWRLLHSGHPAHWFYYIFLFDSWPMTAIGDFLPFQAIEVLTALLPMLGALGFLAWSLTERLSVNETGVRLFLFNPNFAAFSVPWSRVRKIDFIEHGRREPSVVLHYRTRIGLPFSLGVHAKRYSAGREVTADILRRAKDAGIVVHRWYSPDWMPVAAAAMFAVGVGLIFWQQRISESLMREFAESEFPLQQFNDIAGFLPLTFLYVSAVGSLGVGFGMLSGFHRARARPGLLALWVFASRCVPDPYIHWLVWFALYAILSSAKHSAAILELFTASDLARSEVLFTLVQLGPAIAGVAYIFGVLLGRRPAGSFKETVAAVAP